MLPELTNDRCRCTACGLHFLTSEDFDRHRIGRAGTAARRCRTADELAARGWQLVDRWFFTRRPVKCMTADDRTRLAARRLERRAAVPA